MTALRRNLTIEQGTTWTQGWQFNSNGQPMFTSAAVVKAQIRERFDSDAVLHEWSSAAGNATATNDGTVTLTLPAAVSSGWGWRLAVWDLEVTFQGVTWRLVEGRVVVSPEVTR